MKNAVMQDDLEEFSASADLSFVSHDSPSISASNMFATASKAPSYQPYAWNWLNKILDFVDGKTNGKAGQIQRILSYLFFGGLAAMVNLVVFGLALYLVHFPSSVSAQAHYVIAYIIAAECSIMANFLPNDRFTFRSLPGAKRPWLQRCLRFHTTSIVGTLLTFVLGFVLFSLAHTPQIIAEAVAIVIVLIYNFTFHHLFTYRHIKTAAA